MKIAINGFGRIGRALFRIMWDRNEFECISINEPYASIQDISYFLKYDSLYGRFSASIEIINENTLRFSNESKVLYTHVTHFEKIEDYSSTIDDNAYIVEACGKQENISYYQIHSNRKAIFTFSTPKIPLEVILGVNEKCLQNNSSNVISGSICDAVALAPVLKSVFDNADIKQTSITTMHPALSYQKVIDNYPPNGIERNLGRQFIDSIIPKRTSAERVLCNFYQDKLIRCLSFRIPTESVCVADITFIANTSINFEKIINDLQNKKEIAFCNEDLVSIDFKGSLVSATVDMRWTEMISDSVLKMTIWYDNEYGYSSKILDLLNFWDKTSIAEGII